MKYYYGNSYKEALNSNPVEIENAKILKQYQECYGCVFPADNEVEEVIFDVVYNINNEEIVSECESEEEACEKFEALINDDSYDYVILRRINEYDDGSEEVEILDEYHK